MASFKELWLMLRQVGMVALLILTALGSLTLAAVEESKQAGGNQQITNSIGTRFG
jgi:hypothetical protein